jgi:hypothetical protein
VNVRASRALRSGSTAGMRASWCLSARSPVRIGPGSCAGPRSSSWGSKNQSHTLTQSVRSVDTHGPLRKQDGERTCSTPGHRQRARLSGVRIRQHRKRGHQLALAENTISARNLRETSKRAGTACAPNMVRPRRLSRC